MPVAMDQGTDVMVLRYEDTPVRGGFGQQRLVARVARALADIDNVVTSIPHSAYDRRHGIRVREDAHATRRR